jgi:retinol dehydrogenase-12
LLTGKGVTTYSLHPGIIFTDIGRNFLPPITTNEYGYRIVEFLSSAVNKNVWEGAQTTICCAVDSKLEHVTGKYYRYG